MRNYTRWRQSDSGVLQADLLGVAVGIEVDPASGKVLLDGAALSPDEARMIGVRLIDGAVLADGDRAVRAVAEHDCPGVTR